MEMEELGNEEENKDIRHRVVELLNNAAFASSEKEKIQMLSQVQELVIHRDPNLLDSFFEEIVAFQTDKNADVRKFVVGFIEESCKREHCMLPRLVPNIRILIEDQAMSVVKRIVQAAAQLHKSTLVWVASAKVTNKEMSQTWEIISQIKDKIINMVDHENDGVRTQAIKYLESFVLLQTYTEPDSICRKGEICLDSIPLTLKLARPRKLEEEAKMVLGKLIDFQGSLHISSVNLMTCMSSLTIIARARPQFMGKIIEALEILHANLPPTLTKSQVSSVRKHLRIQMLNLLRHIQAYDYRDNIKTILNDLNVGSSEINKALPSKEEIRKLLKSRKPPLDDSESEPPKKKICPEKPRQQLSLPAEKMSSVDIAQRWLQDKLYIENVTNLVMVSMLNLPEIQPPLFSVAYTPVTEAGTQNQIQHVARLLGAQVTAAGLGPGADKKKEEEKAKKHKVIEDSDSDEENNIPIPIVNLQKIPKKKIKLPEKDVPLKPTGFAPLSAISLPKHKFVKLNDITKPLEKTSKYKLQLILLKRILSIDKSRLYGGALKTRLKILAQFTSVASYEELIELENYIFSDLPSNLDLLESWLYSLHASKQDFNTLTMCLIKNFQKEDNEYSSYISFFIHIVKKILEQIPNKERDDILSRLLVESPSVPTEVLDTLLEVGLQGPEPVTNVTLLLKDLILWRPVLAIKSLNIICTMSLHSKQKIREAVEPTIIYLFKKDKLSDLLCEIATENVSYLVEPTPPEAIFKDYLERPSSVENEWTEESVRACLFLMLTLLPYHQDLIHYLACVYVKTVNEAKRTILRYLEQPISTMGMDSPILLNLVETCPKGSETLITRIIHILTEKAPPSEELVCHVRELYNKRVSDVRFLIPVLTGLSKKEVIAVLPKLIKLNPHVVKEVFNRLWGVTLDKGTSPLSPVDLLIALHLIEKADVKTIIKATGLCFAERNIYTAEVLAIVLQNLMEQNPLPTLFMRTVIQTLTHHPKLLSFIINILMRLIGKQVWTQKKVWEGFIRCCQRAVPQSFNVLLKLPNNQLAEVLVLAKDLQENFLNHLSKLTDTQRASIPAARMDIIRNPNEYYPLTSNEDDAQEESSK